MTTPPLIENAKVYLTWFAMTKIGQATLAFLRVFGAALVASWFDAGLPVSDLTWGVFGQWAELAAQAGATLVIVNYFAPWEKRYGSAGKGSGRAA